MNADGSSVTRLSDHGDEPVWSPKGDKIAFSSIRDGGNEIYVMDIDGTNQINLTGSTAQLEKKAVWSPDGNKILYESHSESDYSSGIYVMNADGSEKIKLGTAAFFTRSPWSPDSSKVVFHSYISGEIFIFDADGNNQVSISTGDFSHWGLAWSPDGSHFASQCFRRFKLEPATLCTLRIDGSETTPLPNSQLGDRNLLWSPDGSKLLFYYDRNGSDDQEADEILVVNADGSNRKVLATVPLHTYLGDGVWSPDGSRIVYVSGVTGDREIYVLGVD
jgi:Tol biopolymer transport system component